MLKETIEILFKRHGIPLDDIDAANEKIESMVFDNPSILYPQNRKNGIFEIDWVNSILYVREHRTDVQFDDKDRVEITLEFDNIQRILFKLDKADYEDNLLPGTSSNEAKSKVTEFTLNREMFNEQNKRIVINSKTELITNEINRLSTLNNNSILRGAYMDIIDDLVLYLNGKTDKMYESLYSKVEAYKIKIIPNLEQILSYTTVEKVIETMTVEIFATMYMGDLEKIFMDNKNMSIDTHIKKSLLETINKEMLKEKHELCVPAEVKLKFVDDTKLNSEVTISMPEPPKPEVVSDAPMAKTKKK